MLESWNFSRTCVERSSRYIGVRYLELGARISIYIYYIYAWLPRYASFNMSCSRLMRMTLSENGYTDNAVSSLAA